MTRGLHWFRNDLRLRDNSALRALCGGVEQWLPVFILDPRILEGPGAGLARTRFLFDCLEHLEDELASRGIPLVVRRGDPIRLLPELMHECRAGLLSYNEGTSPLARRRDESVRRAVEKQGGQVITRRDDVVFASAEVRTQAGGPYAVYTPYRNRWWQRWEEEPRLPQRLGRLPAPIPGRRATEKLGSRSLAAGPKAGRTRTRKGNEDPIARVAFAQRRTGSDAECPLPTGGERAAGRQLLRFLEGPAARYAVDRDLPAIDGTSRLSPYLRFGVLSPRQCFARGEQVLRADPRRQAGVAKWLDELIWREFYASILEEHPRVQRGNYRREYDALLWEDDPSTFEAWCVGRTGFPIVDAGMRQLRATGWMHNRVRMIVASFLTKDLLIDWRHGERFFFEQLVDGDPASNNGGWQWAASTGTDAQPYFRIFNPTAQAKRFDPEGQYIRRWIPELARVSDRHIHAPSEAGGERADYPDPIVDHAERRALALERYRAAREAAAR